MLRENLELNSGLVRLHSKERVNAYLEWILEYNKSKLDEYAQQLAEHLRITQVASGAPPKPEKEQKKDPKKEKNAQPMAKGWVKVGTLPVNLSDTRGALAQATLRIVDDYKARVEKITEAIKSFRDIDTLSQGGSNSYTLFILKGVPEAVIVESTARKMEPFVFSATFRAV